jgi:phosphate transport system substrate-binding protein
MMTTVAGDENAIGYLSLGSLNDTVKPLKIDGVDATVENIKAGSYAVSRPFNVVTKADISPAAQDFMNYMLSTEGQAVVEAETYIKIDNAQSYTPAENVSGKIVVAGSSSVTPLMEKLKEAYMALNANVEIDVQQSDSSTGVSSAIDGTCDIGMASRELKDEEIAEGVTPTIIATDGIVVIVNKNNEAEDMSKDQVKAIYKGEVAAWDDL